MDLGIYLEEKTGVPKEELYTKSRDLDVNWAKKFSEIIHPFLVKAGVSASDDSYTYTITDVKICDEGYVCVEENNRELSRLSGILNDWIEIFPKD